MTSTDLNVGLGEGLVDIEDFEAVAVRSHATSSAVKNLPKIVADPDEEVKHS